jgi:hypothetical protein
VLVIYLIGSTKIPGSAVYNMGYIAKCYKERDASAIRLMISIMLITVGMIIGIAASIAGTAA